MNQRVYQLAKQRTEDGVEFIGVDFTPDSPDRPFCCWQGVAYHIHASCVSARDALESWRDHLQKAGADWLVPLLADCVAVGSVNARAIFSAYSAIHDREPTHPDDADA